MTKKDFELLARALKEGKPLEAELDVNGRGAWVACCIHVANACASTNPRFDRERFLTACGVK